MDMRPELQLVQPRRTLLPPSLDVPGGLVLGVIVSFGVVVQNRVWAQLSVKTMVPITERHEMTDLLAGLGLQVVPEGWYLPEWNGQNVLDVA